MITQLQNNSLLEQIEQLLQQQAQELFYQVQAQRTQQLLGIEQKPRRVSTSLETLAEEQNYKPRKSFLIGALEKDEMDFFKLSEMIGR